MVLAQKVAEHENNCDTHCGLYFWNGPQEPGKDTGCIRDQRKNRSHLDHNTAKIGYDI